MTVRWERLPAKAKVAEDRLTAKKPRAAKNHGVWRCVGRNGCGEVIDGTFQSMERHLDGHGGGGVRAECMFTTKGEQR